VAILTLDQLLAGMQPPLYFHKANPGTTGGGTWTSFWGVEGIPGAGSRSGAIAGAAISSPVAGAFPFDNPVSGNSYLARFVGSAPQNGTLLLCDRLWDNGGINSTITTSQTVNSVAFPARDADGSTDGRLVHLGVEVATALAGTSTVTIGYTNSAGTGSRTATPYQGSIISAAPANRFYPISLQAGDLGVRQVNTVQLGTSIGTGVIHLVAYRVLATLATQVSNVGYSEDAIAMGMPRIFNDSALFLLYLPANNATLRPHGQIVIAQG